VSPTYVPIHKLTDCVQDSKVVYRRYASLFFIAGCASDDNELITLEIVHRYVEQMDKYYGNVCELDIIFNFQKAYFILDELLLAGEMQESSKKNVLRCIGQQDSLEDMEVRIPFLTHSLSLHTRCCRFEHSTRLFIPVHTAFVHMASANTYLHSTRSKTKSSRASCKGGLSTIPPPS
jgi:hypothetical protein